MGMNGWLFVTSLFMDDSPQENCLKESIKLDDEEKELKINQ